MMIMCKRKFLIYHMICAYDSYINIKYMHMIYIFYINKYFYILSIFIFLKIFSFTQFLYMTYNIYIYFINIK